MTDIDWNHQYADLPGIQVHYVRHGQGMPVILQHGWPEFWYTWRKNIPVLAEHFDIIAPDLRGFGDSDKPYKVPDVQDYVDDLSNLVEHLDLDGIGIVTHDVGAWIAQAYALRNTGHVKGLFFTNCPYPGVGKRWNEPGHQINMWYQQFHQMPFAAELLTRDRENAKIYFSYMLDYWTHADGAFEEDLDTWVDNFMKPGNMQGGFNWYTAVNELRMKAMRGGPLDVPKIEVPTRVFWGAGDKVLKAKWSDKLGDYFSDLRKVDVVPEAGHFVHYEQPERTNDEIIRFFNSL
ncbi:MAG: alpha/beta hydrolase [Chloroflexi bacterium]|nr:alpha/beta hydrolase [Chloroflexota bacterium]